MGGTDFNDIGTQSFVLEHRRTASIRFPPLKYVPESTWNDTCTNAEVFPLISANPAVTDPVTSCSNKSVRLERAWYN